MVIKTSQIQYQNGDICQLTVLAQLDIDFNSTKFAKDLSKILQCIETSISIALYYSAYVLGTENKPRRSIDVVKDLIQETIQRMEEAAKQRHAEKISVMKELISVMKDMSKKQMYNS